VCYHFNFKWEVSKEGRRGVFNYGFTRAKINFGWFVDEIYGMYILVYVMWCVVVYMSVNDA